MATYGFPWPSMLDCDKFPLDNDMCIASMGGQSSSESRSGGKMQEGKSGGGPEGENHGGDDDQEGRTR